MAQVDPTFKALGPLGWFIPASKGGRASRLAWVEMFPPQEVSGVYAIASRLSCDGTGRCRVLYVGSSHTGRLRKTLARHFQHWDDPTQQRFSYGRFDVVVTWMKTTADDALEVEQQWREQLDPRDNPLPGEMREPRGRDLADDEIPF